VIGVAKSIHQLELGVQDANIRIMIYITGEYLKITLGKYPSLKLWIKYLLNNLQLIE